MEHIVKEAYGCLELPLGSPFHAVIQNYKYLALHWFPSKHSHSKAAIQRFLDISQAFLILYFAEDSYNFTTGKRSLPLDEMLALFHFMFFRDERIEDDDDDDDDDYDEYFDSTGEESYDESDSDASLKFDLCSQLEQRFSQMIEKEADKKGKELLLEEEREKKKASKRKAQKKRRKERKKQEKTSQKSDAKKSPEKSDSQKTSHENNSSESEEDIDPTSAFVVGIAKKKVPNIPVKKEADTKAKSPTESHEKTSDESSSRVLRGRQIALRGNEMAKLEHFQEAIELFSEAIKLDHEDHRFFGNRSYCYERLGNYERAIKDADKSISLAPQVPKGYFRKGKALISIQRFPEAEECFKIVLKLDPRCEDAEKELVRARICQIKDMGFTTEQAEAAIQEHESVQGALDYLLSNVASNLRVKEDLFVSDEEDEEFFMLPPKTHLQLATKTQLQQPKQQQVAADVKMDPKNPEGHNSIWIGNVQSGVTEQILLSLFSKYGEIISVRLMPDKFCAFVNYKNKAAAGKAMFALQGAELYGANLKIRFPEPNASSKTSSNTPQGAAKAEKVTGPVNGDECYFWRTTGCIYGVNCRFRHVREHKGIDKKNVPYRG